MPLHRLPSDPQSWQHELLCLPVHGIQYPNGVRLEAQPPRLPPPPVAEVVFPDPDFVNDDDDDNDNNDTFIDDGDDDDNADTVDIINNLVWLCSATV